MKFLFFGLTLIFLSSCHLKAPSRKLTLAEKTAIVEIAVAIEEKEARYNHVSHLNYKARYKNLPRHNGAGLVIDEQATKNKNTIALWGLFLIMFTFWVVKKED